MQLPKHMLKLSCMLPAYVQVLLLFVTLQSPEIEQGKLPHFPWKLPDLAKQREGGGAAEARESSDSAPAIAEVSMQAGKPSSSSHVILQKL